MSFEKRLLLKNVIPEDIRLKLLNILPDHSKWEKAGENGFVTQKTNRGSYRASIFSRPIANRLSSILKPYISTFGHLNDSPFIKEHGQHTDWVYEGVNPLIRYIRYEAGNGILLPHYDVPYVYDDNLHSTILSIVIYLETGIGGNTRFIKVNEANFKDLPIPDWDREPEENEIDFVVEAEQNDVLVFPHTFLHDSSLVTSGRKTIIRTDFIFRRIQ